MELKEISPRKEEETNPKVKADTNSEAPPTEGKTFAKVLSEIRYRMKPEDSGAEVSSIRKRNGGDVLVELSQKTQIKVRSVKRTRGYRKRKIWFQA